MSVTGTYSRGGHRTTRRRFTRRHQSLRSKVAHLERAMSDMTESENSEDGFYDQSIANQIVSDTGTIQQITGNMDQGVTVGDHVGNSCLVKSLFIRLSLSVGDTTNFVRVIVFQDRNATGGSPIGIAGILQLTGGTNTYLSPLANSERGRWKIYHDKIYTLCAGTDTAVQVDKLFFPFKKPIMVTYAGDAAQPQRNNLYMLLVSDSSAVTHPGWAAYIRVRYSDG